MTSIRRRDATARAAWSVALPVSGWVLSIALLILSGHMGNVTSTAGLDQGNRAGALAFLVAGAMDLIVGTVGIILAVTSKRTQTAPNAQSRKGLATVGLVLNPILVAMGVMALLIGAFLYEFVTSWNF